MAKYELRIKARELRSKGVSIKAISKQLGIAKSTASIWVRDIVLTVKQLQTLKQAEIKGAELGRIRGALVQKQRRAEEILRYKKLGIEAIGSLTEKELLIAGLALYWGEGYKKGRRLQICNSDASMINFMLLWLQTCFSISIQDIRCRVGINEIHKKRDKTVREYWSQVTKIPLEQFTATSFKKVQNKKIYDNFEDHYGTLSIEVSHPARFYGKIIGLIEGLSVARLDSSAVEQSFHKR